MRRRSLRNKRNEITDPDDDDDDTKRQISRRVATYEAMSKCR